MSPNTKAFLWWKNSGGLLSVIVRFTDRYENKVQNSSIRSLLCLTRKSTWPGVNGFGFMKRIGACILHVVNEVRNILENFKIGFEMFFSSQQQTGCLYLKIYIGRLLKHCKYPANILEPYILNSPLKGYLNSNGILLCIIWR